MGQLEMPGKGGKYESGRPVWVCFLEMSRQGASSEHIQANEEKIQELHNIISPFLKISLIDMEKYILSNVFRDRIYVISRVDASDLGMGGYVVEAMTEKKQTFWEI
ncbi:hypothetical protein PoB_002853200 [Plakobranchus ocellatus]|uniref:Uncharacterized protein n=1 Tax=Plakobranchus ocellatus TaxID=259542 RepID=A0AAV4A546_9GAST|nr:hypothetical protein PoB_002853200 [Plakobranchus ocellatus]